METGFVTGRNSKILVITDNPVEAGPVGNELLKAGFDVTVNSVHEQPAETGLESTADLIIIDTSDPDFFKIGLCQKIKSSIINNDIPVILLEGSEITDGFMNGCQQGIVDYVLKPYDTRELIARINTHLKLKQFLREIEEKNKELEKLNLEKNEFLGLAAHDLKNPIYNISMLAKVLRDEERLTRDEIVEFSQDIVDTAERMLNLIKKLLDINAIEIGKININLENIDLTEIVTEQIAIYRDRAAAKNINLHLVDNPSAGRVVSDRNVTVQIIDNLLSNAIKYSPFDKNVFITILSRGEYAGIEVRDEGPGLTEEDKKKLFGKFARLSARPTGEEHSTGLGLSIVKKYVEAMKGTITCESVPGHGAAFIVMLPKA